MNSSTPVPAAQYIRMSTDLQQYSVDNQKAAIGAYAERRDFSIVHTYIDAHRTGLVITHREGLTKLLHDVESGLAPFRAILVYDISRWGRFQDTDESAYYEFRCRKAGIPVHYCAETFPNDGSMTSLLMKSLKRIMAAEYSRELSDKVFEGMRAMVGRGLWTGSVPGYGLRRQLISSEGVFKGLLQNSETKNIKSDRVVLVPGPADEIRVIREIYRKFITERKGLCQIARELNQNEIKHGKTDWDYQAVGKILTHEKYAGALVWGRWTQKLRTRSVPVPREDWTVVRDVIQPIVDRRTFDAAQKAFRDRTPNQSNEQLLAKVRFLLRSKGRLTAALINQSRGVPSAPCCIRRFGSLKSMYNLLGYKREDTVRIRKSTRRQIGRLCINLFKRLKKIFGHTISVFRSFAGRPNLLKFSGGLKVRLIISQFVKNTLGSKRWNFQSFSPSRDGFVTLLCRCNPTNTRFHDFHVVPDLSHFPLTASLSQDDPRLLLTTKLKRLSDLYRVAQEDAKVNGNFSRLEGWREIAEYTGSSVANVKRWAASGMPIESGGRHIKATREELDRWLSKGNPGLRPHSE